MRDLKALGEALRWKLEGNTWTPTGADIQNFFHVNDKQLQTIKKYAKNFAGQQAKVLGYDPEKKYWRIVDHTDRDAIFRIMLYGSKNWRDAGKSYLYQSQGAYNAGIITRDTFLAIRELMDDFNKRIKLLENGHKTLWPSS